jgi:hypothetical protein
MSFGPEGAVNRCNNSRSVRTCATSFPSENLPYKTSLSFSMGRRSWPDSPLCVACHKENRPLTRAPWSKGLQYRKCRKERRFVCQVRIRGQELEGLPRRGGLDASTEPAISLGAGRRRQASVEWGHRCVAKGATAAYNPPISNLEQIKSKESWVSFGLGWRRACPAKNLSEPGSL